MLAPFPSKQTLTNAWEGYAHPSFHRNPLNVLVVGSGFEPATFGL